MNVDTLLMYYQIKTCDENLKKKKKDKLKEQRTSLKDKQA